MAKTEYRIVKVDYKNGETRYKIQKRTRFFWIGPKIWETWYDDYWGDSGWSYSLSSGSSYSDLKEAQKDVDRWIHNDGYVVENKSTVNIETGVVEQVKIEQI